MLGEQDLHCSHLFAKVNKDNSSGCRMTVLPVPSVLLLIHYTPFKGK